MAPVPCAQRNSDAGGNRATTQDDIMMDPAFAAIMVRGRVGRVGRDGRIRFTHTFVKRTLPEAAAGALLSRLACLNKEQRPWAAS